MADIADRLFHTLSTPDFLAMKGLANEVPFFIHAYDIQREDATLRMADQLCRRLREHGIGVARLDVFDVLLQQLDTEKRLSRILDQEASLTPQKKLDMLRNLTDPKSRMAPRLAALINADDVQLALVTGLGRVFPYLRTHSLLEALQPVVLRRPVVLFFPGEYVQDDEGSQLRLFEPHVAPRLSRAYYRAFNLAHYHPKIDTLP